MTTRIVILLVVFALSAVAGDAAAMFQSQVLPIIKNKCSECHGIEKPKAKLTLTGTRTLEQLSSERDVWFHVLDQIESGNMPPEDEKQPTAEERELWILAIRDAMNAAHRIEVHSDEPERPAKD